MGAIVVCYTAPAHAIESRTGSGLVFNRERGQRTLCAWAVRIDLLPMRKPERTYRVRFRIRSRSIAYVPRPNGLALF